MLNTVPDLKLFVIIALFISSVSCIYISLIFTQFEFFFAVGLIMMVLFVINCLKLILNYKRKYVLISSDYPESEELIPVVDNYVTGGDKV